MTAENTDLKNIGPLAEVVFPIPRIRHGFDYLVPSGLEGKVFPGHRVWAPFGMRGRQLGVVTRVHSGAEGPLPPGLKSLEGLVDETPALSEKDLALARWVAGRYFSTVGEAVFSCLPVKKRLPPKRPRAVAEEPGAYAAAPSFELTEDQRAALEKILPSIENKVFAPFLLLGVAAAGKTELYIHAIEATLARGRSALYLVPEIGLTPQVEELLRARFGKQVTLWHSDITDAERWRAWRRVKSGECRVVLGARSAVFAPLPDLGLVVIDEEHDTSYKEETTPRHHAREVALEKARLHNAVVVMGSATPSLESYERALNGAFTLIEMSRRVEDRPFPEVHIVDMKEEAAHLLSNPLLASMRAALARKEQCLLFLNRRGFYTYVVCKNCGWEARCPKCGVSLVLHAAPEVERLRCHYCSTEKPLPSHCPLCKSDAVKLKGKGTQRVETQVQMLMPGTRVLRWDRDTTRRRQAHAQAFNAVKADQVDVVVGTRMVAQGLDFPHITVVGILDADHALRFPDFRAGERTFQILSQVAGRARRAEGRGDVYLQTRHAGHHAIQAALHFDYKTFARHELDFRREMNYPPFLRLTYLLVRGKKEEAAENAAEDLTLYLENLSLGEGVEVLGPAPAFHSKRAGLARWQVILKAPDAKMGEALRRLADYRSPKGVFVSVDVDPEELE